MSEQHDPARGAIGLRSLAAIQTIGIGRLTSDVLPIASAAFIAVSGEGDQADSNGSGKTTFLAAIALLLGDPQWRALPNVGEELGHLLFDPVLAGAAGRGLSHAPHGYVIGVFNGRADNSGSEAPRSAWLRINRTRRKSDGPLQVRVLEGTHIARGATELDRQNDADDIWDRLPPLASSTLQNYGHDLYGRSPRVAAFIKTRGSRGSGPSLLASEVDQFNERQIGTEILRLAGQDELLHHDEAQREEYAKAASELRDERQRAVADEAREATRLIELDAIESSRTALDSAQEAWTSYLASALVETVDEIRALEVRRSEQQRHAADTQAALEQAEQALADVPDGATQDREVKRLSKEHSDAQDAATAAEKSESGASGDVNRITELRRTTRLRAAGYAGPSVSELEAEIDLASKSRDRAERNVILAEDRLAEAASRLESAVAGVRIAHVGALTALHSAGIRSAIGLLDGLQVPSKLRPHLEPALIPWSDAIVVSFDDNQRARIILRDYPGQVLISAPDDERNVVDGLIVPPGATRFVGWLTDRSQVEQEGVSIGEHEGVFVSGPLTNPLTGRDAAIRAATFARDEAATALEAKTNILDVATRAVAELSGQHARAVAAAELEVLDDDLARARDAHTEAVRTARRASIIRDALFGEVQDASGRKQRLDAERALAVETLRRRTEAAATMANDLATTKRRLEILGHARHRNTFAGTEEQARSRSGGRDSGRLATLASELVAKALQDLAIDAQTGAGTAAHTSAIDETVHRRGELHGDDQPADFDSITASLRHYLSKRAPGDAEIRDRIERAQLERTGRINGLTTAMEQQATMLANLEATIVHAIGTTLGAIARRFDELDRDNDGYGAELRYDIKPPRERNGWTVSVEPRWARGHGEQPVSYARAGNTAMKKQRTINLVLAALLDDHRSHQSSVLILDELGDSLGHQHRRAVLSAIATAARAQGITVLATCQDTMLEAIGPFANQILFFRFAGGTELRNRPPVIYGYDNGSRVRLTASLISPGP